MKKKEYFPDSNFSTSLGNARQKKLTCQQAPLSSRVEINSTQKYTIKRENRPSGASRRDSSTYRIKEIIERGFLLTNRTQEEVSLRRTGRMGPVRGTLEERRADFSIVVHHLQRESSEESESENLKERIREKKDIWIGSP